MKKILIIVGGIALAAWYLNRKPSETVTTTGTSLSQTGPGCLIEAENANRLLADAARLLLRMPVDASAWNDAESQALQAISRAESACADRGSEREREGLADARNALLLIRTSLSEASSAAKGGGGFQGALRQERIDATLSSARAKLGLR